MKIVLINGNLRKSGNIATALGEISGTLEIEGFNAGIISIGTKSVL